MKRFLLALFLALLVGLSFFAGRTYAQVPGFKVPCETVKDPEFDSLRPYQASPCGDSPKAYYCNNDYIIEEGVKTGWDGSCTQSQPYICPTDQTFTRDYVIDGEEAKLPILGNTEDVKNSQSASDTLDDATKVNEYVSWYLNGVVNRAEYGSTKNTDSELVNLSGPLQKLLPSNILEAQRIVSVKNASEKTTFADTESAQENDSGKEITEVQNHNQIVVCASKQILGLFGKTVPHECYSGNGSGSKGKAYRLKDWNDHLPPLPWDEEFAGDADKYLKARCEWKGGSYITIPFVNKKACIENPFESNEWSDLFSYIPLANTVDKNAKQFGAGVGVKSQGQTIAERVGDYSFDKEPVLFYPHSQEVFDLTNILNSAHVPKKEDSDESKSKEDASPSIPDYETGECKIVDVRSNNGDQLFPSSKDDRSTDLTVTNVQIHVTQIECDPGPINNYLNNCVNNPTPEELKKCKGKPECRGSVAVLVRTVPKIPYSDEIWKNTVVGQQSVFRQIYPKIEAGAPVSCIADIPGVSPVTYEPDSKTNLIRVEGPAGGQKPDEAKLYFPHLGTVYDYFLKGIQTALRPKGYGEPVASGSMCKKSSEDFGDICAVADKYNIPCCQLKGVAEIETGGGENVGSGSCSTKNGNFRCCNGGVCGPSQVACGQYNAFAGKDKIDMCDPVGSAELLARAMLLKLCQAAGKCNSYDWEAMKTKAMQFKVQDGNYTAAAYFYGLANGCTVNACTEYRWGPGKTYCDSVKSYCQSGKILPDNPHPEFCSACNKDLERAGQTPINCSQ